MEKRTIRVAPDIEFTTPNINFRMVGLILLALIAARLAGDETCAIRPSS